MPLPQVQTPIARPLARDEAYDKLRAWILEGSLRPGELLRDQDIARALGVSRTPVREALRRLEDEGFVETALNRWTRVAPLDLNQAIEIYSILEALEAFALERAQLTAQDLRKMSAANQAMRHAIRHKQAALALRADETFHDVWLARAENSELRVLLAQLKAKLRRVELAYWDRAARTYQSFHEHTAILRALRIGSRRRAIAALKQNWERSNQRLRTVANNGNGMADDSPPGGKR